MTIAALEKAVVRASLRWHNYRERYAPLKKAPGYPQLAPDRWADDHTHDKIEELEQAWQESVAHLAKARKRARR